MSRTIWDEGHEPGGRAITLGVALALTVAVVDNLVAGHVELLFDVCFVMICLGVALLVHPRDFFAIGVLPPLLMLGILGLFAIGSRDGIGADPEDGFLQALVTGLGKHSIALFVGYALTLIFLAIRRGRVTRRSVTSRQRPPAAPPVSPPTSR